MDQVPTPIWQDIASEAKLQHPESRIIFAAGDTGIECWDESTDLFTEDHDSKVVICIHEIFPVWLENRAIREWIRADPRRQGLAQVFPELNSEQEVVAIMEHEHWLSSDQKRQLLQCLTDGSALQLWKDTAATVEVN